MLHTRHVRNFSVLLVIDSLAMKRGYLNRMHICNGSRLARNDPRCLIVVRVQGRPTISFKRPRRLNLLSTGPHLYKSRPRMATAPPLSSKLWTRKRMKSMKSALARFSLVTRLAAGSPTIPTQHRHARTTTRAIHHNSDSPDLWPKTCWILSLN